MVQRFSVSVSDKKSVESKAGHHDKLSGGGSGHAAAPGGAITVGTVTQAHNRDNTSVKKEPLDSHRDRGVTAGRYSPPDFSSSYHHPRVSPPPHHSAYHGYHVDKSLLPPTLSGPHPSDIHGQKFDFFRSNPTESEAGRSLQTNGLC